MSKTSVIAVRITKEMKDDLQILANGCRRTLPDYLRLMIEEAIKTKRST